MCSSAIGKERERERTDDLIHIHAQPQTWAVPTEERKEEGKKGVYMSVAMRREWSEMCTVPYTASSCQKASTPLMKPRRLLNVLLITDGTTRTSGEIRWVGKIDLK